MSLLDSINPCDGSLIKSWSEHSDSEVGAIIASVTAAQRQWRVEDVATRASYLNAVAGCLRQNKVRFSELMTREMGKPLAQSEAEIEKCAWVSEYYAVEASRFLGAQSVRTESKRSEVVFRPLGNVLAIMPWNFPFWQAFRFAVPAIAAGNGVILKHAANVSGCAMAIEEVFAAAVPENLLRTILVNSSRIADIIRGDGVAAVTFTGSTGAGRSVAEVAGSALKKCVLELGGSDPYIVLADADIELAAAVCAKARMVNNGQSCIAAKRFIVVEDVHERFVEALKQKFEALRVGDPTAPDIDAGPMARSDLARDLARQVDDSVTAGATMIVGDGKVDGAWYQPTVLVDVTPGMPAFDEELFGPVAPVIRAKDEADAIALANRSPFGLGAAIFSADQERAFGIAADLLEVGTVAVNGLVQSDPRLPFGGIKESGYGRELGEFGIREFVNIKSVSVF